MFMYFKQSDNVFIFGGKRVAVVVEMEMVVVVVVVVVVVAGGGGVYIWCVVCGIQRGD